MMVIFFVKKEATNPTNINTNAYTPSPLNANKYKSDKERINKK
jgi:hypothetical protein